MISKDEASNDSQHADGTTEQIEEAAPRPTPPDGPESNQEPRTPLPATPELTHSDKATPERN